MTPDCLWPSTPKRVDAVVLAEMVLSVLAGYPGFQKERIWKVLAWYNDTLWLCQTLRVKKNFMTQCIQGALYRVRLMTAENHKM